MDKTFLSVSVYSSINIRQTLSLSKGLSRSSLESFMETISDYIGI